MLKRRLMVLSIASAAALGTLLIPIDSAQPSPTNARVDGMNFDSYASTPPRKPLRALFIHHSCGGQLLARRGASSETADCIYVAHPNGGGLRDLLVKSGYEVGEASYGSAIGQDTDLFHWQPKFRASMDKVLRVAMNDEPLRDRVRNDIVIFKSCFPNNEFVGEGTEPGNPAGPELTLANAKAALSSLLPEFRKHPDVLFVYVTAPPLASVAQSQPLWKWAARKLTGRPDPAMEEARQGEIARKLNDWAVARDGWLAGYDATNVAVFDYFGVLTADGASNHLAYLGDDRTDSHPSTQGNSLSAERFVPFLNQAVRRAGLSE
jgi:hypothetical protein